MTQLVVVDAVGGGSSHARTALKLSAVHGVSPLGTRGVAIADCPTFDRGPARHWQITWIVLISLSRSCRGGLSRLQAFWRLFRARIRWRLSRARTRRMLFRVPTRWKTFQTQREDIAAAKLGAALPKNPADLLCGIALSRSGPGRRRSGASRRAATHSEAPRRLGRRTFVATEEVVRR